MWPSSLQEPWTQTNPFPEFMPQITALKSQMTSPGALVSKFPTSKAFPLCTPWIRLPWNLPKPCSFWFELTHPALAPKTLQPQTLIKACAPGPAILSVWTCKGLWGRLCISSRTIINSSLSLFLVVYCWIGAHLQDPRAPFNECSFNQVTTTLQAVFPQAFLYSMVTAP